MIFLEKYFATPEDYITFLSALDDQLSTLSYRKQRKLTAQKPIHKGSSTIVRTQPVQGLPSEGYYFRATKIGEVTLD